MPVMPPSHIALAESSFEVILWLLFVVLGLAGQFMSAKNKKKAAPKGPSPLKKTPRPARSAAPAKPPANLGDIFKELWQVEDAAADEAPVFPASSRSDADFESENAVAASTESVSPVGQISYVSSSTSPVQQMAPMRSTQSVMIDTSRLAMNSMRVSSSGGHMRGMHSVSGLGSLHTVNEKRRLMLAHVLLSAPKAMEKQPDLLY